MQIKKIWNSFVDWFKRSGIYAIGGIIVGAILDALQDTGILNGNSAKITNYLKTAKSTISEYAKKVCRDQIVLEKE